MLLTGPETVDALAMICGAVALVTREAVVWVDPVHVDHDLIAADLGDDRGGADRSICRIPTDDRLAIDTFTAKRQFRESVAIDSNIIWSNRQAKNGTSHCEKRRLENIQAIDFGRIRPGNRPRQRMLSNLTGDFRSALRSQFLGVSKAVDRRVTVEDDGTGDDRSREWPSPCLIDTGESILECHARSASSNIALAARSCAPRARSARSATNVR